MLSKLPFLGKPQIKKTYKRNASYGYLHMGKTGGSSVNHVMNSAVEAGFKPPINFGHVYTMERILKEHPHIEISVVLRDPIERIISGFNSRMRQSRPTYTAMWRNEEAIAYLWFPTVADYFEARINPANERMKSAALYAEQSMGHVKRGYEYHFHSLEFIKKHAHRFYFLSTMNDLSDNIAGYFTPCGIPEDFVLKAAIVKHSGGKSTPSSLQKFDADFQAKLREFYSCEYEIYDFLKELAQRT